MKLIFLVSDLHLWGGGERVAVLMANHYTAKGEEVTLLSVGRPGRVFRFEISPNVRVDYLNIPLENGWNLFQKGTAILAIRRYLQNIRDDNGTSIPGETKLISVLAIGNFPTILTALVPKRKHFSTVGCLHSSYKSIRHIWKLLRWLLYRRIDVIVSLTQRDFSLLERHHSNIRIIQNPVTFYPEHAAKLENKLILAIGRVDYLKGYDLMIEVFERFCKINNDWKLKIIGEGPLRSDLNKLVKEKGVAERIILAPATPDIEKEYLAASIFLMTSRSEGLPMVLLEAHASGLPIIAFDCETGPAEVITHGLDGFLIRPFDIDEMCARLYELCNNFELRKSFGDHGRQNARRFSPETMYQKWDLIFEELKRTK